MLQRLIFACLLLVSLEACRHRAVPPIVTPAAPAVSAYLLKGDETFEMGNYFEAAEAYESYLQDRPNAPDRDRTLFRLGIALSILGTSVPEYAKASVPLDQLRREFPDSPYAAPAGVISKLQADLSRSQTDQRTREAQIRLLSDELEKKNTVIAALPPAPPPPSAYLLAADAAYQKGDYAEAARAYETYLRDQPNAPDKDRSLFFMAVSLSLSASGPSGTDFAKASTIFEQLIREFPQSNFVASARLIATLETQMSRLLVDQKVKDERLRQITDELERLKQVDLRRVP